jgi:hypothetical protein
VQTQRVTLTRTETVTIDVGYNVDPETKANIAHWANSRQGQMTALESVNPAAPQVVSRSVADWRVTKSRPLATIPAKPKLR